MIHSLLAEFKNRAIEKQYLEYELPNHQVHAMLAYVLIIFCNLLLLFREFLNGDFSNSFFIQLGFNLILFVFILISCRNFLSNRDVSVMHKYHLLIWIFFIILHYGPWISEFRSSSIAVQFMPLLVFGIYFLLPIPFSFSQILIFGVLLVATLLSDHTLGIGSESSFLSLYISLGISAFISSLIRYPIEYNKRHVFALWLEEARQLKEKEELFAIMAHDLRAPINAQAQILRLANMFWKVKTPEEIQELILKVGGSTEHMARLVDNMLSWSRIQKGHINLYFETLGIPGCIREALEILQLSIKQKGINIELPHQDRKVLAYADANLLRTILINFLNNAVKYSNEFSTISINYTQQKDSCTLSIKDTGVGMTQNQISALLNGNIEKSQKGTLGEAGTGLGMKVSLNFLDRLNANLEIQSELGQGSNFIITLPFANP